MHSSIYLTILVVLSLILPDFINLVTSNFSIIDAELKYYKNVGEDIAKYKESLIESLKVKYEYLYNTTNEVKHSECNDSEQEYINQKNNFYNLDIDGINNSQQSSRQQQNKNGFKSQEEIKFERNVDQRVQDLKKKFVSKTSKNEIILDQYNDKVYLISIDNQFLFTDDLSNSYLSVMQMKDDKLYGSTSYERNGDIQWQLCTLHRIGGVIKDIQFDYQKQSFSILYVDIEQKSFIRVYNSTSFCQKRKNEPNQQSTYDEDEYLSKLIQKNEEEQLARNNKYYSSKPSIRFDELFRIVKDTKYDQKNYFDIPLNNQQIYKMAYTKNFIVYSSQPDRFLIKTIKLQRYYRHNMNQLQISKLLSFHPYPKLLSIEKLYIDLFQI